VETGSLAEDARKQASPVDFFVGITPFADLMRLRRQHVLTSWQGVMPKDVVADIPEGVRREVSLDDRIYSWPFLLDVTILGWNADLVERAGIDPGQRPSTWDELVARARQVKQSGAAPYGVTFDPRPWRSLVPVTHSFSADVYDEHGRFDYRSEAAANALEVLRRLAEVANPDLLGQATTPLGPLPDEQAFSAGIAAYYVKYQNAQIRMASTWPDPGRLVLARLPFDRGGAGKTVFWTTGIGLLRYGSNAHDAASYAHSVTYDDGFWKSAIAGGRAAGGHVPVFGSLWRRWAKSPTPWVPDWASGIHEQLAHAEPIPPSAGGAAQFVAAQPALNRYLTGEEGNAKRALEQAAKLAAPKR
jgi:ABC-type glycerol-3-phosphate transport system substrate-binding protein